MTRLVFAITLLFVLSAHAETLTVASDDWEHYSNRDGTGYYYDVLRAIYEPKGYQLNLMNVPFGRSLIMLKKQVADITLGVSEFDLPAEYISTAFPVEMDVLDIAYLPDTFPEWHGLSSLDGKSVVARIDYGFGDKLGPNVRYMEKASLSGMLQMLMNRRVDAVLDFEADILKTVQAKRLKSTFVIKRSVLTSPAYFAFGLHEKGRNAKKLFEAAMPELIQSGKLKALFQQTGEELEGYPY